MTRLSLVSLCLALTAAVVLPPGRALAAAEADTGWQLRVNGSYIDAAGRFGAVEVDGPRARSSVDVGGGVSVGAEYLFSPRLGLEIGILAGAAVDTEVRLSSPGVGWAAVDTLGFTPLMTGVNFHLLPGRRADVYLGPLAAFVRYSDLTFTYRPARAEVRLDDEFCLGAAVGLDVGVGNGGWFFNAQVRYLATDIHGTSDDGEGIRVDFDPLITAIGFGYHF